MQCKVHYDRARQALERLSSYKNQFNLELSSMSFVPEIKLRRTVLTLLIIAMKLETIKYKCWKYSVMFTLFKFLINKRWDEKMSILIKLFYV